MGRWKRPYSRSLATAAAGGVCAVFVVVAVLTSVIAVRGLVAEDFGRAGGAGAGAAFTALVAGVAFRAARCGVFVDARDGVMIRRFDGITSWPWSAVSAVQSRPARLLTFGISAGDEAIWLVLADGAEVETPLRSIDASDYSRRNQRESIEWLDKSNFAMALWTMQDLHRAANAEPDAGRKGTGAATDS